MGVTVLDAGVIIGLLDRDDAHHAAALAAVRAARDDANLLVLPASAYAEVLVAPYRRDPDAVATVDNLLDELPVRVIPIDRRIANRAARVRAEHGTLRLPDALVIGTAAELAADRLITTDRGWPSIDLAIEII